MFPLIDLSLDEKLAEHSMQSVDGSIETKTQKSQYLKLPAEIAIVIR